MKHYRVTYAFSRDEIYTDILELDEEFGVALNDAICRISEQDEAVGREFVAFSLVILAEVSDGESN